MYLNYDNFEDIPNSISNSVTKNVTNRFSTIFWIQVHVLRYRLNISRLRSMIIIILTDRVDKISALTSLERTPYSVGSRLVEDI